MTIAMSKGLAPARAAAGRIKAGKAAPKGDLGVKTLVLDNGIPVLFERMENLRSVTVAVWALIGSRHERPEEYGIAHVVEHMIFKGTKRRTSRQIAESLEFIGGESNAFTSREYSCYYAKGANTDWDLAVDVLSDIVSSSTFDASELEKERKVI
ncbi:MAG: insulinase family protein, partial [Candidatus Wallbacteria bacterium]|nr:insulinase family protein [Candidatus Wallbacteria bacterium]